MDKKYQKILFVLLLIIAAFLVMYLIFGKKIKAYLLSKTNSGNVVNSDISIDTAKDYMAKNNINTPPSGADSTGSSNSGYLPNASGASMPQPNYKTANVNTILRKGSKGNEVLILQLVMLENTQSWNPTVIADGKFGNATLDLLKRFTGRETITIKKLMEMIAAKKVKVTKSNASKVTDFLRKYHIGGIY